MLKITEFDAKTGLIIQALEPETQELKPKEKEVEHSFLETWLQTNQIEAQLSVSKFYDGVNQGDRQRLESEGKVLVFTNGKDGYFTDAVTAKLMTMGDADRGIEPIYAANGNSAHNVVAYGSLIVSDGIASTLIGTEQSDRKARILMIDDEQRSHGEAPLLDRQGNPVPQAQIEKLYDKMGDGTMLVSHQIMQDLVTPQEREEITAKAFEKAGINGDITHITEDSSNLEAALAAAETGIDRLVGQTVTQFRAATPDLPGMIKGTMATSEWCERLGVDAIASKNDIKGDDKRLSQLGVQEVDNFWINRKSDGKYGEQRVGPQVKGCIPEATLQEFNPQVVRQATELAAVAHDPQKLLQYYVEKKEPQRELIEDDEGEAHSDPPPDWLYDVAKSDATGIMTGFSKVNYELEKFTRTERLDNAVRGIRVPSAMAQHHSQLEPWEVCNKDLPHGALVAYYRSPFPNVGAAAIGINNTEIIKSEDPEAFRKAGVAYLNPWTAKNIAITDFDKDANGYFVGYESTVKDLPQQIRAQLQSVKDLSPAQQYEAGRALFADLIEQVKSGQESRLKPAVYPIAVEEFVERNAPDRKPLQIEKQPKIKHPWNRDQGESHAAATWKAWEVTANNPTGKVANVSMTLQSLALETQYIANDQKEPLLQQISTHYAKLLKKQADGKVYIPTDEDFAQKGFPAYHLQDRVTSIAHANREINQIKDPQQRAQFVDQTLGQVYALLKDFVEGPIAENLQTAVDVAKSARGIDEEIQGFAKALQHKEHLLRQNQKDPTVYTKGKELPTNTQEPIGWAVEQSNQLYKDSQLLEWKNEAFRDLFPEDCTPSQKKNALTIAHTYKDLQRNAQEARSRLRENRPEDQQPTLLVTVPNTGSQVVIQRLCDAEIPDDAPIWRASGQQEDWQIQISRNKKIDWSNPEVLTAKLVYAVDGQHRKTHLGHIAPESADQHHLIERLHDRESITIQSPIVEIRPPFAVQNDADVQFKKAAIYATESIAAIAPEERPAYLSAMWRDKDGMDVAIKLFTPEVVERLQQKIPEITVIGLQHNTNQAGRIPDGEYAVKFSQLNYVDKSGQAQSSPSIAIIEDGEEKQFGAIEARSVRLPEGTIAQAHLQIEGKVAKMQVLEVLARDLPVFQQEQTFAASPPPSPEIEITNVARSPLTIVTDGKCPSTSGTGGWAAILVQGENQREIGATVPATTGNRIKMTAAIEALHDAKSQGLLLPGDAVTIVTDSELFINGATGAKRKANLDLWAEYEQATTDITVTFDRVRSGSSHELKDHAEQLASAYAQQSVQSTEILRIENSKTGQLEISGKPVKMVFPLKMHGEQNPLPVDTCIEAMRGHGRTHTTRTFEPHAAYGFTQGDIAIAYAGNKQVAFQVGEQYRITPEMIADPAYQKQWAEMEKHSAQELQSFQGKTAWGLKMEPLGDYVDGKIIPFQTSEQNVTISTPSQKPIAAPAAQVIQFPPGGRDFTTSRSDDAFYSPTRLELRDWYLASRVRQDEPRMAEIMALGSTLKNLYNIEQGSPTPQLNPPLEYRHAAVQISERDREQMQDDISRLENTVKEFQSVEGRSSISGKQPLDSQR
jgi:ribonuclease HI